MKIWEYGKINSLIAIIGPFQAFSTPSHTDNQFLNPKSQSISKKSLVKICNQGQYQIPILWHRSYTLKIRLDILQTIYQCLFLLLLSWSIPFSSINLELLFRSKVNFLLSENKQEYILWTLSHLFSIIHTLFRN